MSTLDTATRTVESLTANELFQCKGAPQRHRVCRENNSSFLFLCRPLDIYLHFTYVSKHFIVRLIWFIHKVLNLCEL